MKKRGMKRWVRALGLVVAATAGGLFAGAGALLAQEAPQLVEEHRDWRVYHYGSGDSEICYILSEPVERLPKGVQRGKVFFTVTHRAGGVRNEIGLRAGYQFNARSKPFVQIDGRKFSFYTGISEGEERAHWAWMRSPQDEATMVAAMKKGNDMVVKGTSSRGTLTTDRYSLIGFTRALSRIDGLCP